jgi:hypothetical protein
MLKVLLAPAASLALAVVPAVSASAATGYIRERPTNSDAHYAAHYVLDDYVKLIDDKLVVTADCKPIGAMSRVCFARARQHPSQRWRIVTTALPDIAHLKVSVALAARAR